VRFRGFCFATTAFVLSMIACASLSGYDPTRYEGTAATTASSVDPETIALPPAPPRPRMLDPRSPVDAAP
jgi:hypothetical protein